MIDPFRGYTLIVLKRRLLNILIQLVVNLLKLAELLNRNALGLVFLYWSSVLHKSGQRYRFISMRSP